jgi:hypothetical protein
MIYRHVLNTLTDEEMGTVLHVINNMWPIGGVTISADTLPAMKLEALHHKLTCAANQVKPESIEKYKIICSKLGLQLKEKNEDKETNPKGSL